MTDAEFEKAMADVRALRRKKFAVKVNPIHGGRPEMPGAFLLSTTTNGRQWNSLSLTPDEAIKVCAALMAHIAGLEKP